MNKSHHEITVAVGLLSFAVLNTAEPHEFDNQRLANMISGSISDWLNSEMRIDNFLYANGIDVDEIERILGAPISELLSADLDETGGGSIPAG